MNWTASAARNSEDLNLVASPVLPRHMRPTGETVRLLLYPSPARRLVSQAEVADSKSGSPPLKPEPDDRLEAGGVLGQPKECSLEGPTATGDRRCWKRHVMGARSRLALRCAHPAVYPRPHLRI